MAIVNPQGDPIEQPPEPETAPNTPLPQDQFNQPPQASETQPPPAPDDQISHYRQKLQQPTTGEEAIADLRAAVLVLLERAGG